MKRLISVFILFFCVGFVLAQKSASDVVEVCQMEKTKIRTFSMNGKSIKVDVEKTVKDYYQGDVNGRWYGIPVIIECGAKEYNIAEAQYLLGISYMEGIDRNKNIDEGMKWLKKQLINSFLRQWESLDLIAQILEKRN